MLARGVLLSFVFSAGALSQPAFDVASVKQGGPVRPDGLLDINLGTASHGTVTLTNTTLSECIRYAYGFANEDQIAGPDWLRDRSIRFSIVAKAPPDTPGDELRAMMQTLLKDRFRMEMHREHRKVTHFDLAVDKNGSKMPRPEGEGPIERRDYGPGRLSYKRLTMERLAVLLSRLLKEPVFNRTGLDGAYNVDLNWRVEDTADTEAAMKPDIFAALRQQLGLRLEASKEPVEVLVVDRAEKTPVGN